MQPRPRAQAAGLLDSGELRVGEAVALGIRQRLLISHLFAVVVLAGAFGAFVYASAERQLIERLRIQLAETAGGVARALDPHLVAAADGDATARAALAAALANEARNHADIDHIDVVRERDGARVVVASSATDAAPAARAGDLGALAPLPGGAGYAVDLAMRRGEVGEKLYILRLSAALAFLVCVLVALLLSRHLAGRIIARITDLTARCRALANGEPLPPRRPGPHDELDDLAREFDAMAGRLRHAAASREQAAAALREANASLESRVRERTAELEAANAKLKAEIEQRLHVEALLAEAAMTDPLTGLLNRRAQMEMLEQAAQRLKPGEPGLSIILVDLDHFKQLNDRYGHSAGDRVLTTVAARLRDLCGGAQAHCVARWGGEEFLVLLPGVRLAAACKRAEELRREVAALRIDRIAQVTASFGVAELVGGESLDACLKRCDQALYRAKEAGRDAVVAAQGALFATMS